nr:MAG TPA: hypothetical protein [Bacteriophage sp.]
MVAVYLRFAATGVRFPYMRRRFTNLINRIYE